MIENKRPLLKVNNLSITFPSISRDMDDHVMPVIQALDFNVHEGEIVALVGASGSGKSLLADAIFGILPKHASVSGDIYFEGERLTEGKLKQIRGSDITLIPQSVNALDPLMKVGKQANASSAKKTKQVFSRLGLNEEVVHQYPFELSGGMKRRVLVATALAANSKLIVADEPTPGLDPKSLNETVKSLADLVTHSNAMIFITHDIITALKIAHKIIVFKDGETVEIAQADQFSGAGEQLETTYAKELWQSLPQNNFIKMEPFVKDTKTNDLQLRAHHISYQFKSNQSLFKDITFTMETGEIVGMYGSSGIGKTTFSEILCGYKKATSGALYVNDKHVTQHIHEYVQLIWQHPEQAVNPQWKMKKVLEEVGEIDDELLDLLDIKVEWLMRRPRELSGGELQRFCVARALMTKAPFIVADEMTTMLDAITQAKIWDVVLHVARERQMGVLVISHDMELLKRLSDRIIPFEQLI